jgi:hypothetical protein
LEKKEFSPGPTATVFLLDIIDSNSPHGPVRELHRDNGISNQINQSIPVTPHVIAGKAGKPGFGFTCDTPL